MMSLAIALLVAGAVSQGLLWCQQVGRHRASRTAVLRPAADRLRSASLLLRWTVPCAAALLRWSTRRMPWLAQWQRPRPGAATGALPLAVQSGLLAVSAGLVVAVVAPVSPAVCGTLAAVGGAAVPWLDARAAHLRRRRELTREWERFLELLALALEAGIELVTAIAKIFDQLPPSVLRDLLEAWYREVRLGRRPEAAWRQLAKHAELPAIDTGVTLLLQALRFGTPLAALLRGQASLIREVRLRQAEYAGAVASHKILLPVMCCMLPAYFLLTFGGVLVRFLTGTWTGLW